MNEIFYSLNHNFDSYFQRKDDVSIIMDKIYPFVKGLLIEKYILGKKFIAFLYSFNLYQSSLIFNITRLIKLTNIYVNFKIGRIILKDRKSTRLNSSHVAISYAVFCLKKKKKKTNIQSTYR